MYRCNLKSQVINNEKRYAIYNFHTSSPVVRKGKNENKIIAVFIDPAVKTCALRIVKNNLDTGIIETKVQTLLDFTTTYENEFGSEGTTYYGKCWDMLDEYLPYFLKAHYIIIEHQYYSVASEKVIRIAQHIISYFLLNTQNQGNRPLLIEIDPKLKTTMLGLATSKKLKKEGKKLKIETTKIAMNILRERNEEDIAESIEKLSKRDDHGDTICYDYMWWIILDRDAEQLNFERYKPWKEKKGRINI